MKYKLLNILITIFIAFIGCKKEKYDFQAIKVISSVSEYQDVRWCDLRRLESQLDTSTIKTLTFNEKAIWPDKFKSFANELFSKGKNPGLKIRELHEEGITGKGVIVAIIDQNICQDHPEYNGKIIEYYDVGCNTPINTSSMHAPAVTSLLVGDSIGVAPDARLYFVAAPSWTADSKYFANALNWIVEKNKSLPEGQKIRAVSVSSAPSGPNSLFTKNTSLWDSAYNKAIKTGLIVIDCSENNGFISPCYNDINAPNNISLYRPGFPGETYTADSTRIFVPNSHRTVAEEYELGKYSYTYYGKAGLSWAAPYLVGVLALGWQLRPDISGYEMLRLLKSSSYLKENGVKIIQPETFIDSVRVYHKI